MLKCCWEIESASVRNRFGSRAHMADEYNSVLTGGLSLKGGLFKNKKKKSKRKRDEAEAKARVKEGVAQYESRYGSGEDEVESGKEVSERDGGGKNDGEEGDGVDDMLTPAQRRFRDKQLARESKKIRSMVEKTHRERVEEFNALLASMTEHNDIPRCSAAGNG